MSPLLPAPGTRVDIYALIHKGIRAALADALHAAGRLDWTDDEDVSDLVIRVQELAALCRGHLTHENDHVHAAMEARRPGSTRRVALEHEQHLRGIARLEELADLLARLPALRREPAARALYATLSAFTAENLEHMLVEESDHNRVLWETHSDEELIALEQAIVASLTPEENQRCLRWMLPFMTPAERAQLLAGMREQAPPAVFQDAMALVGPLLGPRELAKLHRALGIPRVVHDYIGVA